MTPVQEQHAFGAPLGSAPHEPPPPAEYAAGLSAHRHGPHDDDTTSGAACLAAETIRYLCYATSHGGIATPSTVSAVTGELSAAACRLTQVLAQLAGWLDAQARAGRLGDDHHRPAAQVTADASTALMLAARHAADLAAALAAAQNLTGTLHPAAPAEAKP